VSSWEWQADEWLAWARTPGHDSYWHYRDLFLDAVVPDPGHLTLDVGCGEGRVARDLARLGHTVVAVDASPSLVASAAGADPDGHYLVADAAALPFPDAGFDAVITYNSLMDVADMPTSVAEAARVLRPGGHLCICITHPTAEAGKFQSKEPDQITFTGWRYALEEYARALEDAGLLIERLREPAAPPAALAARAGYERWQRLPSFLHLRAVKPA
jgi:ubiquinone/menaquinone biosynthesis C-methylase UbiE